MTMERAQEILRYWLGDLPHAPNIDKNSPQLKRWFKKSDETDKEIREKFEGDLIQAKENKYTSWENDPHGRLALVILLDQFPRNLYRNSSKSFENDPLALKLTLRSLGDQMDQKLKLLERTFLYMPLMHGEDLKIQKKSLACFHALVECSRENELQNSWYFKSTHDYAIRHFKIVERFGRYPHRNEVLGRKSTPEEIEFLNQPGSSF